MIADEVNFCPRCGSTLVKALYFGRQRPACPTCGWIYFADPKVAVAALVEQKQSILLVRRINEPQRGLWTLPAGFVDAEEDPVRAAERECLEEAGLYVHVTGILDVLYGQEHPRGAHILIVYRAEILSGEIRPGDDADQVSFFDRQSLPPLAFTTTQRIIETTV
jgi:ADP-ribose pyrophosphatase YjhB (NUDIX family)